MRRAVGGVVPGVAIAREDGRIGDALLGDQAFERGEPVPVIGVAAVGVARRLRALDLRGKRRRPFRPGEEAAAIERQRHREGLRLPRLVKDRPALVARQARHRHGSSAKAARSASRRCRSRRLQIGLERLDRDGDRRIGLLAPQFARR